MGCLHRIQTANNMSKARIQDMDNDAEIGSVQPPSNQQADMEKQTETPPPADFKSAFKALGILDQFLALWILLAMIIGVVLGNFVPKTGPALQKGKFVGVSVPIAVGLLIMMYPILCKVRFETLHHSFRARTLWIQVGKSLPKDL